VKNLTLIFTTNHADTRGNACLLEMVRYLSSKFNITIITNRKDFIKSQIGNCKVESIKNHRKYIIAFLSDLLAWKNIAKTANEIESIALFMFDDTSSVTLWLNKPVFKYVSQFGERTYSKTGLIKEETIFDFF